MDDTNNVLLFTVRFWNKRVRVSETQRIIKKWEKEDGQSSSLCISCDTFFKSSIFIFLFSFRCSLFCCWLSAFKAIQSFLFGLNHHVLHYHILGIYACLIRFVLSKYAELFKMNYKIFVIFKRFVYRLYDQMEIFPNKTYWPFKVIENWSEKSITQSADTNTNRKSIISCYLCWWQRSHHDS